MCDLKQIVTMKQESSERDGSGDSSDLIDKTKLIINYIPQIATEDDLYNIFSQVGEIEHIRIMRDHRTGYSYGFGFIKYKTSESARKAIEVFNGMTFKNKRLKVSYSRPPGQMMKDSNLYITNLPKNISEEQVEKLFGPYGEIVQRTVLKDKITGMPRGVAFVRFSKTEEAQAAIASLDGKQLENSMLPLSIRVAQDHGRQKAHYFDFMSNLYMLNCRGLEALRMPYVETYLPRGNFPIRGNPFQNMYFASKLMSMGAGDNYYQNNPNLW